jgi:hypothetical protein
MGSRKYRGSSAKYERLFFQGKTAVQLSTRRFGEKLHSKKVALKIGLKPVLTTVSDENGALKARADRNTKRHDTRALEH